MRRARAPDLRPWGRGRTTQPEQLVGEVVTTVACGAPTPERRFCAPADWSPPSRARAALGTVVLLEPGCQPLDVVPLAHGTVRRVTVCNGTDAPCASSPKGPSGARGGDAQWQAAASALPADPRPAVGPKAASLTTTQHPCPLARWRRGLPTGRQTPHAEGGRPRSLHGGLPPSVLLSRRGRTLRGG